MIALLKKYKEIILYLIFGVATTLTNWVVYTIFIEIFGAKMTLSNAVAWFIAVIFAFITNKIYVFGSKAFSFSLLIKELFSFFATRLVSGVIEIFFPEVLFNWGIDESIFGIDGFVAKILTSVVVIILNYIFSKFFVFKKKI